MILLPLSERGWVLWDSCEILSGNAVLWVIKSKLCKLFNYTTQQNNLTLYSVITCDYAKMKKQESNLKGCSSDLMLHFHKIRKLSAYRNLCRLMSSFSGLVSVKLQKTLDPTFPTMQLISIFF